MNKIKYTIFISIASFVLLFTNFALANEQIFDTGDGSESNPFQIKNCSQLQYINHYDAELDLYPYLSGDYYYILMNDIDCMDTTNWNEGAGFEPIGKPSYSFIGNFNGDKHIISNLYINLPENNKVGLFGAIGNSVIKNIGLEDLDITGYGEVGGLVGSSYDSHIENTYTTGSVLGIGNDVGGLVGSLVGLLGYFPDTIVNSYSVCDVSGNAYVGGLIGKNNGDKIYNSFAVGVISGSARSSGGFMGSLLFDTGEGYTVNDFVFNSGWYDSVDNSIYNSIGNINGTDTTGDELSYNENDNTLFYSKSHGLYGQDKEYPWNFNQIWTEIENNYPKFISESEEEQGGGSSSGSSHSSGSSAYTIYNNLMNMGKTDAANKLLEQFPNQIKNNPNFTFYNQKEKSLNINRILKYGMEGDDVKELQTYLNSHGYECGSIDGKFGQVTKSAVIKFQLANSLIGDGVVGPLTIMKLK